MFPGSPLVAGTSGNQAQVPEQPVKKYYTGQNIHATATSRTAITDTLQVGDIVIEDPHGHDRGKGNDVTQPQTSYLNQPVFVVTAIHTDETNGAASNLITSAKTDGAGTSMASGWIEVQTIRRCEMQQVNTKANMTKAATILGPANASFALQAKTAVDTLAHILEAVAIAQETYDSSTTAAKKLVAGIGL